MACWACGARSAFGTTNGTRSVQHPLEAPSVLRPPIPTEIVDAILLYAPVHPLHHPISAQISLYTFLLRPDAIAPIRLARILLVLLEDLSLEGRKGPL